MPPNSEEGRRLGTLKNDVQWTSEDDISKEKQRPPIYNPEDYASALRKWSKRSTAANASGTGTSGSALSLYSDDPQDSEVQGSPGGNHNLNHHHHQQPSPGGSGKDVPVTKDYRNPMLTTPVCGEMSLRQFSSVSELLTKLRVDLRLAFPSFVQEFTAEPIDGVTLLLELLRGVQLSQTGNSGSTSARIQRRALVDELACLQCLANCCVRRKEAVRRLASTPVGLYTLAVCIMSNVNRSRVIALQLLTMACEDSCGGSGHTVVSEALSTLRLRFGEPVRFRFLVGILSSPGGHAELLAAGLKFLNSFVISAGAAQKRLYVQAELEQAGFNVDTFKKIVPINSPFAEKVFCELEKWERSHVNVEKLAQRSEEMIRLNDTLKEKVKLLERRVQILQEEKGILLSLEQCLKERCCELQDEVTNLRNGKKHITPTRRPSSSKRDDSTPAEDEGISSSERSLSPDDDVQREPMIYEVLKVQNDTILMNNKIQKESTTTADDNTTKKLSDEEEETTIEEVIEELRNIINDAETEVYEKDKTDKDKKSKKEDRNKPKIQMKVHSNVLIEDSVINETETIIVPSNLHPQPPRRTRSLVHLFFPTNENIQYESRQQEMFFEEENPIFSTDEESDSLLSASKCQQVPRIDRQEIINNANDNRALLNSIMDARERAEAYERKRQQKVKMCEAQRKLSMKRNESLHNKIVPKMGVIQIKEGNIKTVQHNSVDGLYIVDVNSPSGTPIMKQNLTNSSKCRKQVEESNADKIRSKSLDRIDEGLDTMVDIVVTSNEMKQNGCHRLRHNSSDNSSGHSKSIVVVSRSGSNAYIKSAGKQRTTQFPGNHCDQKQMHNDDKHRVFLPNHTYQHESSDYSHRLILPNRLTSENSTNGKSSFTINRGHTNAGLYSGYQIVKNMQSSISSNEFRTLSPNASKNNLNIGKVTDLASGLY